MAFDRSIDAAAFVAALSRFLNSPEGSSYNAYRSPLEVMGIGGGQRILSAQDGDLD